MVAGRKFFLFMNALRGSEFITENLQTQEQVRLKCLEQPMISNCILASNKLISGEKNFTRK